MSLMKQFERFGLVLAKARRLKFEVRRLTESFQADRYPRERGHRPLNSNR